MRTPFVLRQSAWRRDALRTNLWFVPVLEVLAAVALFAGTYALDQAAYRHNLTLPGWVNNGSADAARTILTAIGGTLITVVGLVFSITIVALTLASQQFGPRMLRTFVRDRGTQLTLGSFVATFVYSMLALGSVGHGAHGDFVPHLSITVLLALTLVDLMVLIYFIHHVALSIQLPQVIASIAQELSDAIDEEVRAIPVWRVPPAGPSEAELLARLAESGRNVPAPRSGYLQYVAFDTLTDIAARADAVIRLHHRPGHFLAVGFPLATVWPAEAEPAISQLLERLHFTGPSRTLTQDLPFAIDQLVEIAIRALSAAVNDTFSALTCIDWLSDGLCKLASEWEPRLVHRDRDGSIRVIATEVPFSRFVERAFDKIRQSSVNNPAVMIRQLEAISRVIEHTRGAEPREELVHQAQMIIRSSLESVPEESDRIAVRVRHDRIIRRVAELGGLGAHPISADVDL